MYVCVWCVSVFMCMVCECVWCVCVCVLYVCVSVCMVCVRTCVTTRSWSCSVMYKDFVKDYLESVLTYEQLPFDHPLFIMYSSGTTGTPKCMVHSAGVSFSPSACWDVVKDQSM